MKLTLREMILISIFAALTAVGAFIRIPTPLVPFTLQFLFCAYSGVFLGGRKGLYSQMLYVGIGLIGIPVFASGGGPAYVLQPTFGYLLGFIACSYTIGQLVQRFSAITFIKVYSAVLLGLFFVYVCGVGYLYLIINFYLHKQMTLQAAIGVGLLPYITSDLILSLFIALTAIRVIPILKKSGYYASTCNAE
ncbi:MULTISPECIES: biotin transporter BioY [Pelosinus]|jgi:biotin transport system substrate-specific component|uniref:Biotin transporter n=1 Tax=Pelosinus fermentans B4 TaxID=1149862 RepID=I9LCA0_9FIRM|nr:MULTISPECIES: biotin transporter BioY [Pelosinus]EIW17956.1 BioY protein [Pelosinus fermentans B4]EIW23918.1 BioY protein [Pelosinus fermentans A11]OAM94841.1 BioY protein [Pelosinus fermentans DSM 17108]SDR18748.1 biotin transport system substrate-specific component [Pelosinus fermentans]